MKTAVILLAGGVGARFGTSIPKQFITLGNQPLIHYSLDVLSKIPSLVELVIVCASEYQPYFSTSLSFASPGPRRQDSVFNGLRALKSDADLVCIHDGARPFVTLDMANRVIDAANEHGAATAGVPLKFTVKECNQDNFVVKTPDRSLIWEIQTPQVIRRDLLVEGFAKIRRENVEVTDDVAIIERMGQSVKLVEGSCNNIKITTREDLLLAEQLLFQELAFSRI